jgi:phasin family protein
MAGKKNGGATAVADEATTVAAVSAPAIDKTFDAIKDGVTGAVAGLAKTQAEVHANMEKVMKSAEDFVSFGQGNVEAFVKSGQIWAAGVQTLSKSFAATAQAQMDAAVSTMKALAGVKSLKDAVELQTSLARSSVETVMAETGKLTDASMKLAEQAIAPITARVTLAVEKFARAA